MLTSKKIPKKTLTCIDSDDENDSELTSPIHIEEEKKLPEKYYLYRRENNKRHIMYKNDTEIRNIGKRYNTCLEDEQKNIMSEISSLKSPENQCIFDFLYIISNVRSSVYHCILNPLGDRYTFMVQDKKKINRTIINMESIHIHKAHEQLQILISDAIKLARILTFFEIQQEIVEKLCRFLKHWKDDLY